MGNGKVGLFSDGFAVLMAVYYKDNVSLFEMAVKSVFRNSLLPMQFLIVVDGPLTVELNNIVKRLKIDFPSLEFLELKENKGLAIALNEGLKLIRFPWVIRADADDYNLPERFFTLAKVLEKNPNLDLLGSAILEVDEEGREIAYRNPPQCKDEIRKYIKFRSPFNHMSVVFKLKKVLELGGYPNIFLKEDYALWANFISHDSIVKNIPNVLVRVTAGNEMYKRRGGLRYVRSEIELQKFLIKLGLQSKFGGIVAGSLRSIVFLMPNRIRTLFYLNFLRKRF